MIEDLLESSISIREIFAVSTIEDNDRASAVLHRAQQERIPVNSLSDSELKQLSGTETSQGILAIADIPSVDLGEVLNAGPRLLLLLDGVQDPGNFGTLARSGEALGAGGLIALPGTVDPWNPKSVRAAAGSSFRIPVVEMATEGLGDLTAAGYRLLGADMEGEDVSEVEGDRLALVMGNEGGGLSTPVRDVVDQLVSVPIRGRAESLNVAAAAAILMYELLR